jgi:hypothetical protein
VLAIKTGTSETVALTVLIVSVVDELVKIVVPFL